MKIALIGVTGRVGSRLATELLSRGHAVTGIALHVPPDVRPGLTVLEADATKPDSLAPRLMGHDAVISASRFVTSLMDTDGFPEAFKAEAMAGARFLERLRAEPDLDSTFLSPSADFAPGERTGRLRLGGDQLLSDAEGKSHISMEDFAIAMVDELEQRAHRRQRFTVGY